MSNKVGSALKAVGAILWGLGVLVPMISGTASAEAGSDASIIAIMVFAPLLLFGFAGLLFFAFGEMIQLLQDIKNKGSNELVNNNFDENIPRL
ncbi:hypothetical protein FACS1894105_00360 [Clostridia bacterium]|nr:hypothetical protein FACS1894105_00360 [Clostridia bacterium]